MQPGLIKKNSHKKCAFPFEPFNLQNTPIKYGYLIDLFAQLIASVKNSFELALTEDSLESFQVAYIIKDIYDKQFAICRDLRNHFDENRLSWMMDMILFWGFYNDPLLFSKACSEIDKKKISVFKAKKYEQLIGGVKNCLRCLIDGDFDASKYISCALERINEQHFFAGRILTSDLDETKLSWVMDLLLYTAFFDDPHLILKNGEQLIKEISIKYNL